jgi:pSer/pThr/pTyr-binding forkhead associated (FHA) protein
MLQIKQKNAGSRPEWLVENRYTFGTGVENNYKVSGEGVQAIQAGLEVNGDAVMLFNLAGGDSVRINGEVVEKRADVKAGDVFSIGDAEYLIDDPKLKRKREKSVEPKTQNWTLKAKNTALANKTFELQGSKIIGRSNDCDICLNVVHLSRNHARISVRGSHIELEDLNSSNGTYVNGKKIEKALVKAGDEITFDTLKFTVLGPQSEFEKTQSRANDDGDATTLRPAISASEMAKMSQARAHAGKAKPSAKKPAETPVSDVPKAQDASTNTEQGSRSGLIMIAVVGVAIAVLVGYMVIG